MKGMYIIIGAIVGACILSLAYLYAKSRSSAQINPDIGLTPQGLKPCPSSPNCVSTTAKSGKKKMEPLSYTESRDSAKIKLKDILAQQKNATFVTEQDNYIHLTFKTPLLSFVDDVEFYFPKDQKVIHFRSASRVGYSDLGANKRRMSGISLAWGK